MSAKLGDLVVSLEANMAKFTRDLDSAAAKTESAMGKMKGATNLVVGALALVGVGLSFGAIVGEANKAVDALAGLDDMAQKTGGSIAVLSKLAKVAEMTGQDMGGVEGAITKLAVKMTTASEKGNTLAKAMGVLGLSTKDIEKQDPAELFVKIANKLQDYGDGAGKAALMQDAMGKSAAELLPFMNDVSENIDKFTGTSKEAAAAASAYQDSLGLIRVRYTELTTSIVSAALPAAGDFVGALSDLIEGGDGVTGINMAEWADNVAIGLARVADVGMTIPRIFSALSGSVKVVMADISVLQAINSNFAPVALVEHGLNGTSPTAAVQKVVDERNKVLAAANAKYEVLFNTPLDKMEAALLKRMAARNTGGASGDWGRDKPPIDYKGGDTVSAAAGKSAAEKALEEGTALIARLKEQSEAYGLTGAALLSYQLASSTIPDNMKQQALALQTTVDGLKAQDEATKQLVETQKKAADETARAVSQNKANVEQISMGLMTEVQREQGAHQERIDELMFFHDVRLENVVEANALIEAENLRHEQTKAAMQMQFAQQAVGLAGDSASQLYNILQSAGMEQTALGKALFIVNKAIAVAEIIMNTEVGAAKALAMGPIIGPPLAMIVRVMGYAAAGIVIGTTIASAEGGYDIPAGTNPVTQLHEQEMVLPKAQANVIRDLAAGGTRGGPLQVTYAPVISIDGSTDMARNQQMIRTAVAQGNADLVDKLQRAGKI